MISDLERSLSSFYKAASGLILGRMKGSMKNFSRGIVLSGALTAGVLIGSPAMIAASSVCLIFVLVHITNRFNHE